MSADGLDVFRRISEAIAQQPIGESYAAQVLRMHPWMLDPPPARPQMSGVDARLPAHYRPRVADEGCE